MANVWTGAGAAKPVLIHPVNDEDGALVGPSSWTNTLGSISPTAKFGSSYLAPAGSFARLDSDTAVTAFDNTDSNKYLCHFWWRTESLAPSVQSIMGLGPSGHAKYMTRASFHTSTDKMILQHLKEDQVTTIVPEASSLAPFIALNQFNSFVCYVDVPAGTGKIFVNGIDRTTAVLSPGLASTINLSSPFARIGNHINLLDPSRFVDHPSIIQDTGFTDAIVAALVFLYKDTRSFGFRPVIISLSVHPNDPTQIIINGEGFGPDATVTFDGLAGTNVQVFGDGTLAVTPPATASGLSTIAVTNVAAAVTVTESALTIPAGGPPSNPTDPTQATDSQFPPLQGLGPIPLNAAGLPPTIWTENGLSNRRIMAGDNLTPEMRLRANDPLPVYHPRVKHTTWTQTQPADPAL